MNIMLFSKICAKSGVGNHMRQLADELINQGNKVWIVAGNNEQEIVEQDNLKMSIVPVSTHNPIQAIRNLIQIHRLVKENNIDVVHCHHRTAALYMKFYRIIWETPVVYTLHITPVPHDFIHRIFTYVGDKAIGVSSECVNFMEEFLKIPQEKCVVIPNGIYPPNVFGGGCREELLKKFNLPTNKVILVMNCRISEIKNQMHMIEAVHQLNPEVQNKVVVAIAGTTGGTYYDSLIKKIEEYGLQNQFRFVGWVDSYELLAVADMSFLPSYSEGLPLGSIESFFMKVPAARTETGGYKEMQDAVWKISATDVAPTVDLINRLVKEGKEPFESKIECAYELANNKFTVEKMALRTRAVYTEVTGNS